MRQSPLQRHDPPPATLPPAASLALQAYEAAAATWANAGGDDPLVVAWAPGRINLIGEHTDYNDGWVLPVAVNRAVAIAGRASAGTRASLYSAHHGGYLGFSVTAGDLARAPRRMPLWGRYVRAVLAELASGGQAPAMGIEAAIAGDVPVGGGMSSSAALTVATATFAAALGWPKRGPLATARLCQRAEQHAAGVHVGLMDQAIACLGRRDEALLLDCRAQTYTYIPARLRDVALVSYDTGVARSLAGSDYNARRHECEDAARLLAQHIRADDPTRRIAALRDVTDADLACYGAQLPAVLLRRARHVVTENERVLRAAEALRLGESDELGMLLAESHASLRDDFAVSCPELDAVVEIASAVPGVVGARMMGAGFGGSALVLVDRHALPALADTLAREYPRRTGHIGTMHVCTIAGGPAFAKVAGRTA